MFDSGVLHSQVKQTLPIFLYVLAPLLAPVRLMK